MAETPARLICTLWQNPRPRDSLATTTPALSRWLRPAPRVAPNLTQHYTGGALSTRLGALMSDLTQSSKNLAASSPRFRAILEQEQKLASEGKGNSPEAQQLRAESTKMLVEGTRWGAPMKDFQ